MRSELSLPFPVKRLMRNTRGRDFIVADLHGHRDLLEQRLTLVEFDRTKDRLLSVGDLVDRGPFSYETLRLITEPWFHFVIGNHEAMLLTYMNQRRSNYHSPGDFLYNGGDWFFTLTESQRQHVEDVLLPILLEAPLVLQVDDAICPFNVLHAEACGAQRDSLLCDADLADDEAVRLLETPLTWGRRLVGTVSQALATCHERAEPGQLLIVEPALEPGLSLTYVGHTILSNPVLHRSHLFLDCGGYLTGSGKGYLMLVEHRNVVELLRVAGTAL